MYIWLAVGWMLVLTFDVGGSMFDIVVVVRGD